MARQAPLAMGFSRQEYWSGLPCPPPGELPDPGMEPSALQSPVLAGGFPTPRTPWEALGTPALEWIHLSWDRARAANPRQTLVSLLQTVRPRQPAGRERLSLEHVKQSCSSTEDPLGTRRWQWANWPPRLCFLHLLHSWHRGWEEAGWKPAAAKLGDRRQVQQA